MGARLRALQQAEQAAAGPERHWGENEKQARTAMEDYASACENRVDVTEARENIEAFLGKSDPRAIDEQGFALLHHAAMYGSVEGVAALLRKKANLNSRTK